MKFNEDSRQKNAMLASVFAIFEQIFSVASVFIYRTIFLSYLSKEYLGIEGLFTNILQLFSLAELGIGMTILYRMYKPFADKDVNAISAHVHFYKNVYHGIALLTATIGGCLYPFIDKIVDASDVPSDVNLRFVYVLFVLQSVASYLFVYKQSIIQANQRAYLVSGYTTGLTILNVVVKVIVLAVTRKYELVLMASIVTTILINWIFSLWITHEYKEIFQNPTKLTKDEKKDIIKDTTGLMCHKVGFVVLTSTDNIILTKMVGLAAVGIYTNYATITAAVQMLLTKMLNSFTPTIGNFMVNYEKDAVEDLYKKLLFVNFWFTSFCTVCLYVLLNPFIEIWLDDTFLLSGFTVAVLCSQFYIKSSQTMNEAFINAAGLFTRDRVRPLIEASLNLVISIVLAKEIGIAGVFIGTCVSSLLTCYWRQPYLLYKHVFKNSPRHFVVNQIIWVVLTCVMCYVAQMVCQSIPITLLGFVLRLIICGVGINIIYLVLWHRSSAFQYFFGIVMDKVKMIIKK